MNTAEEFWAAVERGDGCWNWLRGVKQADRPYGVTYWNGRKVKAHRLAWQFQHGSIPEGMHVLHRCDNPRCVRPDHLFLGTHLDNMRDMRSKGRVKPLRGEAWHAVKRNLPVGFKMPEHCIKRGAASRLAKLTERDVLRVRLAWKHNRRKYGLARGLAAELGVDRTLIWLITTNRIWVTGPHAP